MMTRTYTTHIEASPEDVYEYISDVSRHPQWAHERIAVTPASGTANEPGATFDYAVHFMGETRGKLTIIEATRPSRFGYECDDPTGLYRWTFDLVPDTGGTRLTHVLEFVRPSLKIKLIRPVMLPLVGNRMVTGGLANIKARIESATQAAAEARPN